MNALPTWEDFNVPVLEVLGAGGTRSLRDLFRDVALHLGLTDDQRAETLPSGQLRVENRIGWAVSYLTRVEALRRPVRAHYEITDLGRNLLRQHPQRVSEGDLKAMAKAGDEWWVSHRGDGLPEVVTASPVDLDPTEQAEQGIARIHNEVAAELLTRLRAEDSTFFEQAVVQLLVAMGYGGAGGTAGVTSASHDGGIDGVIDQDVLGLNKVYVQAKRYKPDNVVQRPELQGFVGALAGKAEGGVFLTTSRFSKGAVEYALTVPSRLILIDGVRLTELMIRYEVGVQVTRTLKIVEIDEDFFT